MAIKSGRQLMNVIANYRLASETELRVNTLQKRSDLRHDLTALESQDLVRSRPEIRKGFGPMYELTRKGYRSLKENSIPDFDLRGADN